MLSPNKIKLEKQEESKTKGIYSLAPLPKGYGHTLGNSFRRVLLSSIMGAAVTKVKMKNATHEFSVINGIKEDVFNILLNIKNLNIAIESEDFDEVKLTVSKKGVGEVKGSDIKTPSNVRIANPDLVICNLTSKDADFEAELYVKNGYGYIPSEEQAEETAEVGLMHLDSAFSPVTFANYTVSTARLGGETELDKLTLEIHTNGSILPFSALQKCSALLRDFYTVISGDLEVVTEEVSSNEPEPEEVDEKAEKAKEIMVDELNLPTRTINALKKHKINTLSDLAQMDEDRLLSVRNLGEKSIEEIKKLLKKEGLSE
ncbi:DNA-directed RNA polymerase subunit alpha [candidate division WWE3 bacterium CG10_big_fil_rev_8_21_14_0_10_32_10]|uniref:DNA-directed RNA polymerase subunit alpha n=1 Tax=candidate division WWE3 bacterium CG10_big_fil_rev_8_21_14_0_10_32_10 TaxID=1975090 RepID=A0A2H0RD08_UNCKA|nr:MAG: DNA-directed RNA polymerase subunit alpha [candidate division WWE3 bacterium CG10_big_fil_rev_8_21_14_0_10_32_10]